MGRRWPKFLRKVWERDRIIVNWLFDPRDLWVGLYWKEPYWEGWNYQLTFYVTIIPTLPLQVTVTLKDSLAES